MWGLMSSPSALVIGGGSGIGAALVTRYREADTPVTVWDIEGDVDVQCDIAQPEEIEAALHHQLTHHGVPRWVTVTAGVGHSGLLLDTTPEEWDRVMRINLRGPWLCMRAVAALMIEAEVPGSIIATSSVSAHLVDRNMGTYCASKAALSMTIKVAAAEWGPSHIRVNGIGPGVTKTPMLGGAPSGSPWLTGVAQRSALQRLGEADDIAQAVLALHQMEWVTGQVLDCDGGLSLHSPIDSYGAHSKPARLPR
jgi:NAD(P)-dependent dehydrogenase (short-subunit alcohol dehydrogenase family)